MMRFFPEHSLLQDILLGSNTSPSNTNSEYRNFVAMEKAALCINKALDCVEQNLQAQMTTQMLADIVKTVLLQEEVDPGFHIHVSPEEILWHGIPGERILQAGEIVSVDVACSIEGWWADIARTFSLGSIDIKRKELIRVAKKATKMIYSHMKHGYTGKGITKKLMSLCHDSDIRLIPEAAGHGLGKILHDHPIITYDGRIHPPLHAGCAYTVEPVLASGTGEIIFQSDGSAISADNEPSAHFELSVVVMPETALVLGNGNRFFCDANRFHFNGNTA